MMNIMIPVKCLPGFRVGVECLSHGNGNANVLRGFWPAVILVTQSQAFDIVLVILVTQSRAFDIVLVILVTQSQAFDNVLVISATQE